MPNTKLERLRVAVTGGTSGLGLALVRLLVAQGAHVAFVARTARAVERTASETAACGIVGDIGRKEDIYPIALQVTGNLGGLDALINNASSLGPTPLVPLADTECEELEAGTRSEPVGSVPFDQGPVRRSCRFRTSGLRVGRDQHFQRRGSQSLCRVGCLRRQQGGAPPPDGDLGRGGQSRRRLFSLDRSRRHGYAAPRTGRAGCRSEDAETASGLRGGNHQGDARCVAEPRP